jgi:hypothetical protein
VEEKGHTSSFVTNLKFSNASQYNVGKYYCVERKSSDVPNLTYDEDVQPLKFASVYVYVNGKYELKIFFFRAGIFTPVNWRSG